MQFDHTFIAIRPRSVLEICDLALHVIRDHFKRLLVLLLIGAMPWIVLDGWLLWPLFSDADEPNGFWLLIGIAALLVVSQAQVGTSFMTHYLGQAMFEGRPSIGQTLRDTLKRTPSFLWVHGVLRLVIPALFLAWLSVHGPPSEQRGLAFLWLILLMMGALIIRSVRPFVSEILLLEKTPWSKKNSDTIRFAERSRALHHASGSYFLSQSLTLGLFIVPITFSFFSLFVLADAALNLQTNSETPLFALYWLIALWLAAGFAAVVRFLTYIDTRIRQEGWAVELKMRAEGAKLAASPE